MPSKTRQIFPGMKIPAALALICSSSFLAQGLHAAELVNDGWSEGQSIAYRSGFTTGDIGAARFSQVANCPCVIGSVRFFYGGASATRTLRLHVWEDDVDSANPGLEKFSGDFELTADNETLQAVDLSSNKISVNGAFRIGIEFLNDGLPGIARDTDGNKQADANFIYTPDFGWNEAGLFGITGDLIIRVSVESESEIFKDGFEQH